MISSVVRLENRAQVFILLTQLYQYDRHRRKQQVEKKGRRFDSNRRPPTTI
jgi:hypothetical protein